MHRPLLLRVYYFIMQALMLVLPFYLNRRAKAGKEDSARLNERHGIYQTNPFDTKTIWLHGVSVGEVSAALALAKALLSHIKEAHFIITTNTVTAAKLVEDASSALPVTHYYVPFDAPSSVGRFFDHINADFGVIFESDFWPCLLNTAHERGTRLYLASAQMSESSFQKWASRPALAAAIFGRMRHCFCHDDTQAGYFQRLGLSDVTVTGSLKLPAITTRKTALANQLVKAANGRAVILGASTHQGEERQLLDISAHLEARGFDHFLIMAPRHPIRGDEVASLLPQAKRFSRGEMPSEKESAYILDSLGQMASLYQAADIVWLGATFSGKGGHNPLEAAGYGKPVISGLSQFKNQYEFDQLTELGLVTQIVDTNQTAQFIMGLYQDKEMRDAIAKKGRSYAKKAQKRSDTVAKTIFELQAERQR